MINFIVCISTTGFSKDFGPANNASWHSVDDFLGYASLMGASAGKIEEFRKTGAISFLCTHSDSNTVTRYSYTLVDSPKPASLPTKKQKHDPCSRESIRIATINYLSPSNRLRM